MVQTTDSAKQPTFISTSIAYLNAAPHIGYALECVQADVYARWKRLRGYPVFSLTGTDENAIKIVEAAEAAQKTPRVFVDTLADTFLELKNLLHLSYDRFIRTTDPKHIEGAQKFWSLCERDIYKKTYEGWYCVGCEAFYQPEDVPDMICPLHKKQLEHVKEENYFFALSRYQTELEHLISTDTLRIEPVSKKHEMLNFIRSGLEDFSISRPVQRTKHWGIPVPGDDSHRMYVWFDALTNYITALGFAAQSHEYQQFWNSQSQKIHIIGKDIVKFHTLYWPAMLLSANLPLPNQVFVHGFITADGKKMSKTLGNVVDPFSLVTQYGTDAVRYYVIREIPTLDDGDFSYTRMGEIYNNELSNELGNLLMRVTTLAEKDGLVIQLEEKPYPDQYDDLFEQFAFHRIVEEIGKEIKTLNKSLDDTAPWKRTASERAPILTTSAVKLYRVAHLLEPFIPDTSRKIRAALTGTIKKASPIFPRLT